MNTTLRWAHSISVAYVASLLVTTPALAEPTLRKQVDQAGDFVLFGNTLGWDCSVDTGLILEGTAACSTATNGTTADSAIDLYWRAANGAASATSATASDEARSVSVLVLPNHAQPTYARVYWAAYQPAGGAVDQSMTLELPGGNGSAAVTADECFTTYVSGSNGEFWYQCTADVTELIQKGGAGGYAVSGVNSVERLARLNDQSAMSGWAVVVFYASPDEPTRNLALFDGLDSVAAQSSRSATLSGFLVPNAGYQAKLGVIAYEGDEQYSGDQLVFNETLLSDALNPVSNFFNSTRSYLGVGNSNAGDLPRLTGAAGSMGGMDLDVVDVTAAVEPGATSATITAKTDNDRFALGAFVTSISTLRPDFSGSTKTVVDLNGGDVRALDVLEYTLVVTNSGTDTAVDTLVTDALPTGVTYVADSMTIDTPLPLLITDEQDGDPGEYDAQTRTLTVRLSGSSVASESGVMVPQSSTTVRFRVSIDPDATGTLANQAQVSAAGQLGAPKAQFPTDGNGSQTGTPPTSISISVQSDAGIDDAGVAAGGAGGASTLASGGVNPTGGARATGGEAPNSTGGVASGGTSSALYMTGGASSATMLTGGSSQLGTGGVASGGTVAATTGGVGSGGAPEPDAGTVTASSGGTAPELQTTRSASGGSTPIPTEPAGGRAPDTTPVAMSDTPEFLGSGCDCRVGTGRHAANSAWLRWGFLGLVAVSHGLRRGDRSRRRRR